MRSLCGYSRRRARTRLSLGGGSSLGGQAVALRKAEVSCSQASVDQLQFVASAVPALLCYVDSNCRYVWANEAYRSWLKVSPEAIPGKHIRDVLGETGWRLVRGHIDRVFAGEQVTFSHHFRYPGGARDIRATYTPQIAPDGRVLGFVGLISDISEVKSAERALGRSERLLRRSQSAAHVGSWEIVIDETNVESAFTWWSDEQYRIFGYEPGTITLTETSFIDAVHPDDRQAMLAASEAARARYEPFEASCRIVRPDGTVRWLRTYAEFERDDATKFLRMLGTCQDVTERHLAEEALRDADRRKDEFLAMLAHELRNPLAPILTAAELLEDKSPTLPPRSSLSRVIARQVQHMKRLLDDLLDVSRVSRGKIQLRREPVELGGLLRQTLEASQRAVEEKRQVLHVDLTDQALWLDADPTRIIQVFSNLMTNASKYTDFGGKITLTSVVEDGQAVVTVRDNGIGMRPDLLACAFDLFVQDTRSLDRAQGGLGIGLTLVRTLVELHGGSVNASSEGPNRGSEFIVRLPLTRDASESLFPSEHRTAHASTPPPRALRILVVDDNVDAANGLASLLERLGHTPIVAYDGRSALLAAEEHRPDLVVLDIGLPGMDGYTVASQLRQTGRPAVLVALTGYGQDEFQRRSEAAGFDHHLVKPVDVTRLREIVAGAGSASAQG